MGRCSSLAPPRRSRKYVPVAFRGRRGPGSPGPAWPCTDLGRVRTARRPAARLSHLAHRPPAGRRLHVARRLGRVRVRARRLRDCDRARDRAAPQPSGVPDARRRHDHVGDRRHGADLRVAGRRLASHPVARGRLLPRVLPARVSRAGADGAQGVEPARSGDLARRRCRRSWRGRAVRRLRLPQHRECHRRRPGRGRDEPGLSGRRRAAAGDGGRAAARCCRAGAGARGCSWPRAAR